MSTLEPAESSDGDDGRTGNGTVSTIRISPQALDGIIISCQRCQNASPFSLEMQQCSKCHSFFANQKIPLDLGKEELLALIQGSTKRVFSVERQDLVRLLGTTEQQQQKQTEEQNQSISGIADGRRPLEPIRWATLEDMGSDDDRIQALSAPTVFRRPIARGEFSWVLIELRKTLLEASEERDFFSGDLTRGANKHIFSSAPKEVPFGFTVACLGEQYMSDFLADQLPPGLEMNGSETSKEIGRGAMFVNQSDKRGSFYSKVAKEESILLLLSSSDDVQIWLAPEGKGPVTWYGGGLKFSDAVFKPEGWQYCIKGPPKTMVVSLPVKVLSRETNANKRKAPADWEIQRTDNKTSESPHADDRCSSLAKDGVPTSTQKRKRLRTPAKQRSNMVAVDCANVPYSAQMIVAKGDSAEKLKVTAEGATNKREQNIESQDRSDGSHPPQQMAAKVTGGSFVASPSKTKSFKAPDTKGVAVSDGERVLVQEPDSAPLPALVEDKQPAARVFHRDPVEFSLKHGKKYTNQFHSQVMPTLEIAITSFAKAREDKLDTSLPPGNAEGCMDWYQEQKKIAESQGMFLPQRPYRLGDYLLGEKTDECPSGILKKQKNVYKPVLTIDHLEAVASGEQYVKFHKNPLLLQANLAETFILPGRPFFQDLERKTPPKEHKKSDAAKSWTVKKEKLHGRQAASQRPRRAIHKCGYKPACNQGFEKSGLMWVLALDEENWDETRKYPVVYASIPEHLVCETCHDGTQPPPVPDRLPEEAKKRYKYARLTFVDYQQCRDKEPLFGEWVSK